MTQLALVTGASSGIGRATALALGRRGWRVVVLARRAERLEQLVGEIDAAGGRGIAEACDASDGAAVLAMAERVMAEHGVPDVIVNSAGAGDWGFIEETPPDAAVRMMGAPYFAAYNTTHAFMKPMLDRKSGIIVHVGSPFGWIAWPGATAYGAARWALRGLHEALTADLIGTGVHSCFVLFGEVSSEYFDANKGHEHIPKLAEWIPVITPEACADVILQTIDRPKPMRVAPLMARAFLFGVWLAPGLMSFLTNRTGRKH